MAVILVVDDDTTARDLIKTVLGYGGHEVHEAHDGAEALLLVHQIMPALVIVDLLMPRMDGMEFVRRLRRHSATMSIHVIFYTASYLESQAQHLAQLCGVTHFINKPADPEQIFAVVNAALGERGAPLPTPAPLEAQHDYLAKLTAALSQKAAHVVPKLESMIALGLRLASERDPERLLADFCEAARKIVGAKSALVTIQHDSESAPRYQFTSGLASDLAEQLHPERWQTEIHRQVLLTRRPHRWHSSPGDAIGVHALLCAPILSPHRVYGWLSLFETTGGAAFNDEDEALAQILAAQVGRIYENGSLYREVKQLNADLERRIEERTAQLMEANKELESFGYTVSHDLRAPLRALVGHSTMALESEADRLSDRGRRYLQANIEDARRLSRLVDDLLCFARLGRQALKIEPVDMNRLVGEVWNELIQQESAPSQLQLGVLPEAQADPAMLREVWTNLLSNALKYSRKNPARSVTIHGETRDGSLQYSVRDNGVGFDPAYADKLFKVFERLHSASEFEGTGAGLAIVDRIVRRHGGRVGAHSVPGEGATFYFTLPIEA